MNYKSEQSYMKILSETLYNNFFDTKIGIETIEKVKEINAEDAVNVITSDVLSYYVEDFEGVSKDRKILFENSIRYLSCKDIKHEVI